MISHFVQQLTSKALLAGITVFQTDSGWLFLFLSPQLLEKHFELQTSSLPIPPQQPPLHGNFLRGFLHKPIPRITTERSHLPFIKSGVAQPPHGLSFK